MLNGIPTKNGKKVDGQIFAVDVQFLEETGYEPPQGDLKQILSASQSEEDSEPLFKITKSRWQLSEDPEDRKDGLWIWGLFAEPLYPFMLLQLETDGVKLPGEEDDEILPLKLFAQINHSREDGCVSLSSGTELKIRELETMKADPFGAASVDIYEEVSVGQLNISPL